MATRVGSYVLADTVGYGAVGKCVAVILCYWYPAWREYELACEHARGRAGGDVVAWVRGMLLVMVTGGTPAKASSLVSALGGMRRA